MTSGQGKKVYRFARLTPEREQKITELESLMRSHYDPLPKWLLRMESCFPSTPDTATVESSTRLYCYAFLQSREWNVQNAFAMLKESTEYRLENKLDETGPLPPAVSVRGWDTEVVAEGMDVPGRSTNDKLGRITAATRTFLEMGYHYWDRNGLPTFYMMLGSVAAKAGIKKLKEIAKDGETPLDLCWTVLQHIMGIGEVIDLYQQQQYNEGKLDCDASEGRILSSNIVLDMKGFSYRLLWKPAIDLMRAALRLLFRYYPDCVHRIYVVNCSPMLLLGYKLIRPTLPASVQRKLTFANPNETLAALSSAIDPRYIPSRYGGECNCAGGCFAYPDTACASEKMENEEGDVKTEQVSVSAGSDYCRVFTMLPTDTVAWDFTTSECGGIAFAVYFVPSEQAAGMRWSNVSAKKLESYKLSATHLVNDVDTYVAKENGTLLLMWANRKSWFSSKQVHVRVYKETTEEVTLDA